MYPKDGTLLVCFFGDRARGARPAPRLAVWREQSPLEEIEVPQPVARMIALLAMPAKPNFTGAGAQGKADRIAAALGSPLRQRSAAELRQALGYEKTQEWRVRRALISALDAHGLGDHVDSGRGRIRLRETTSDVAALVCAVRHGKRDLAVRLAEALGEGSPDRLGWLCTEGWWPAVRDSAAEALAQAKAWQGEPRGLPAATAGREGAGEPTAPESPPQPQVLPVPWSRRHPARRGPRARRRWILAGASLMALAAIVAGLAFFLGSAPPSRALLPGSWPTSGGRNVARIANLENGIPLAYDAAARTGDTLLLRMRLPGERSTRSRPGPVAVSANLESVSREGVSLYTSTTGFYPEIRQGSVGVFTGSDDQRVRVVPSTTELVDPDGEVVRPLPDLRFGKWNWVGRLPSPGPYFVDTQLRVVEARAVSPGQISRESSVRCDPTESRGQTLEVKVGTVVSCTAHLVNLGPSILPNVRVRIGCSTWWNPTFGRSYALRVTTHSNSAEPKGSSFTQTVEVSGGRFHGIAYVPGSAEVLNASLEKPGGDLELRERPSKSEITFGPLEADAANALFLRFKARIY